MRLYRRVFCYCSCCIMFFLNSCISIPRETVVLSETIGKDMEVLYKSHYKTTEILYSHIKNKITEYINTVYAPYLIHTLLSDELIAYKNGNPSLYGDILQASETDDQEVTELALSTMIDFSTAIQNEIQSRKDELLLPIEEEEKQVLKQIEQAYENIIYSNTVITNYLSSARDLKEAQLKTLSSIGLGKMDSVVINSLVNTSNSLSELIEKGKEIDIKSDEAVSQIEDITTKIKAITNK